MKPGRQTRLAEIGTEGQEKLFRASVQVRSSNLEAREIERRYLEGAGIEVLIDPDAFAESEERASTLDAHALEFSAHFSSPSARIVAEGARNALVTVREILELT